MPVPTNDKRFPWKMSLICSFSSEPKTPFKDNSARGLAAHVSYRLTHKPTNIVWIQNTSALSNQSPFQLSNQFPPVKRSQLGSSRERMRLSYCARTLRLYLFRTHCTPAASSSAVHCAQQECRNGRRMFWERAIMWILWCPPHSHRTSHGARTLGKEHKLWVVMFWL
jgi:hypothetical protein